MSLRFVTVDQSVLDMIRLNLVVFFLDISLFFGGGVEGRVWLVLLLIMKRIGKWSLMSIGIMQEIRLVGSWMLVKRLSIRVAEVEVTRVGLLIVGRIKRDRFSSRSSLVGACESNFSRSMLKSPM